MPSPLFKSFTALQQRSLRQFRATDAGRLVSEIQRLGKHQGVSERKVKQISRQIKGMTNRSLMKNLASKTEAARLVSDVEKYARGDIKEKMMEGLFEALGPVGGLIRGLLRPKGNQLGGVESELRAASNLLQSFGFDVKAPDRRPAAQRRVSKVDQAQSLLESLGFTITPPKPTQARQRTVQPQPVRKPSDKEVRKIGGRTREYKPDDPMLTGEMIAVSSSNVHSIGFIWNDENPMDGTLQVRFLQSQGRGKGGGPLYYYYGVHPDVFDAFRRAASKGEFVWDRLRIRGTVSGHRFAYDLKGITGGYVPRQAKRFGQNEYFVQRRVRGRSRTTGETQTFESELDDRRVGTGEPQRPGFGLPNRGRVSVNRGTPNRGR